MPMRIAARMALERPLPCERREPRENVAVQATMRALGYHGIDVVIRTISPDGFMAEADGDFPPGSFVRLRLPGLGAVHARVVWADGRQLGGEFLNAVQPSRLGRILGMSRQQVASPSH
jgi:hypothetical protein